MVPHKTVKLTGDVGKTANLNPRDGANPATSPRVLVEVTLAKCIVQIACDGVGWSSCYAFAIRVNLLPRIFVMVKLDSDSPLRGSVSFQKDIS